jgi:cytosine/adenosine deaminase-related metal-dependent hydrolase
VIHQVGQRAFVGKVSMDRNSPDFYIEETVNGCEQAENFVNHVLSLTPIGKEFLNTIQSYEKSTVVNGLTYPPKSRTISVDFSIPSTSSFANTDIECNSEIDLETIRTRARHDSIVSLASVDMHNLDVCKSYDSLHALDTSHINIDTINLLKRKRSGSDYSLCLEEYNTEISIPVNPSSLLSHDLTLLNKVNTPLVMPCITPRFVPTCTSEMMSSLGHIARKYGLPVQSHMSESVNEIQWVADLHPDCDTYAGVYEKHGLLHDKVYMAHCCQSPPEERAVLARTGASAVHCASSNFMLSSGVMDVRSFLDEGIKVAIGTDVAGGYSPSMLDAIRQTIVASRVKGFDAKIYNPPPDTDIIIDDDSHHENTSDGLSVSISSFGESKDVPTKPYKSLNYAEVFYLATVGGAEVLNMGDVIGNFKPNKKLDCLIVDIGCVESPIDLFGSETILQKFEKFLFLGDDRNIESVYVDGRKVL